MSNIAIKVENISKAYQLGEFSTGTLSNDVQRWWTMLRGKEDPYLKIGETNDRSVKGESDIVWSLKDINFEINQGDAVGIIGKNGAGKSTLLKLLSRVTSPTTGSIKVKGRIASLLEVGTGFHPELTGRENIYLNGAILGMRKKEITKKFDEIVAFSGVERYIDTPVKRYSSGMYVRLAFAVAAHLESEILIVDEVLAVGDAEFQKKCLGKMGDVSKSEGRTVLFVSHNMGAVKQLCQKGIFLSKGKIYNIGNIETITNNYLNFNINRESFIDLKNKKERTGSQKALFEWAAIKNSQEVLSCDFNIGEDIIIEFKLVSDSIILNNLKLSIEIKASDGLRIGNMIDIDSGFIIETFNKSGIFSIKFNDIRFYPGYYYISLYSGDMASTDVYDYIEDCLSFSILNGGKLTTRPLPRNAGFLFLTPEWRFVNEKIN